MASASSNLDNVAAWLRRLAEVDFTQAGAAKALGEECLDRVAERCQDRSFQEQKGAGTSAWDENAPAYKRTKKKKGKIIGVLSGEMLSPLHLSGIRKITPYRVEVTYGKDQIHRDRLSYFTRGSNGPGDGPVSGAKNQPPRPGLFSLDDIARQDVMDEVGEYFDWLKTNPGA